MRSAAAAPPGGGAPLEGKHINVQPTIKNQVLTWSRDLTYFRHDSLFVVIG